MQCLLAAAAFGLLFHFGDREVKRFERAAAAEIASKLEGEDKRVSVSVRLNGIIGGPLGDLAEATIFASHFSTPGVPLHTEPERSKAGFVRLLRLDLRDFRLAGLRIEELKAEIPECRYDYSLASRKRQIRLSRSGVGTGRVRVLERDLEAFILLKFREIKRVKVRLDRDKVFVEGFGEFLVVQTNFYVVASLECRDGVRLTLENSRIFFDDRAADEFSRKAVLDTLNPVIDLDEDLKLEGAIRVRGMRLRDGALEAWGETRIPERRAGTSE